MSGHAVRVHGTGRVELAAFGLADAEHQVEKELGAAWPGCTAEVLEVARAASGPPRIVDDFVVRYRVSGTLEAPAAATTAAAARAALLRGLRERFAGTRFRHVAWTAEPGP